MLTIAKEFGVTDITPATLKPELITRILQAQTEAQGNIFAQGILEIVEDGFGFLRRRRLLPSPDDVYVGSSQVRRLGLRTGDYVTGQTANEDNEKYVASCGRGRHASTRGAKRRPLSKRSRCLHRRDVDLEIEGANLSKRLSTRGTSRLGTAGADRVAPKAGRRLLRTSLTERAITPTAHHGVLVGERPRKLRHPRSIKGGLLAKLRDPETTRVARLSSSAPSDGRDVATSRSSSTR